jgi:hypothetical protein
VKAFFLGGGLIEEEAWSCPFQPLGKHNLRFIGCMGTMHPLRCLTNQTLKEAEVISIEFVQVRQRSNSQVDDLWHPSNFKIELYEDRGDSIPQ